MDAPLLALLIIAANTLITYFLLNRQEKRLAQQNFKYQTRFADLYTKRVRTSEVMIQKYLAFRTAVVRLAGSLHDHINSEGKNPPERLISENEIVKAKISELQEFYIENKLFLSPSLSEDVYGVIVFGVVIDLLFSRIIHDPMVKQLPDDWIRILTQIPIVPEGESVEGQDVSWLIQLLVTKLRNLSDHLERVYRFETAIES